MMSIKINDVIIMKILFLLIPLFIFYVIHTIRYTIEFKRNILFSKKIKLLHYALFWLIPFAWILIIKALSEDTKGTDFYYSNKSWIEEEDATTKQYGNES